jgi:hypothetical protein
MKIVILESQSLFDLAVQTAGGVEAAFELALKNNIPLTEDLTTGQELTTITSLNKPIADYYTTNRLKPATGLTAIDTTILGSIFDDTFDDTFYDTGQRIFDFTFHSSFE